METQIFHHGKLQFLKNPLKEIKILQDIITLELISSFNISQNIIFQKSSYKNKPFYYLWAKIPYATILHNDCQFGYIMKIHLKTHLG